MSEQLVCDASALVSLVLAAGREAEWVQSRLRGSQIVAPTLVHFEVSNVIRGHEMAGLISADTASQAHDDVMDLAIEQWPYELLGQRVWELRANLSAYDAGYVAVAEQIDAPLITLDARLSRAPGIRCAVEVP